MQVRTGVLRSQGPWTLTAAARLTSEGGVGHGTYLGDFSWTSTHCTLLTSLNPPNAKIFAGHFAYLASHGDLLRENYRGKGGLTQVGDKICLDTLATFADGTGRFEHATGHALEHACYPASIQGPVIHDLVVKSSGEIRFGHHHNR